MERKISIFIVESSVIIRSGLMSILRSFNVDITEISDFTTLAVQLNRIHPDLLIINVSFAGLLPPAQIRDMRSCRNIKIIALVNALTDSAALKAYDDVITVYDSIDRIKTKISTLTEPDRDSDEQSRLELSPRERDIVICVVKGLSNKQIADELCLSAHTVMTHRRNIATKLQIHSASGLTIYAIVNKLVDINDIKYLLTSDE